MLERTPATHSSKRPTPAATRLGADIVAAAASSLAGTVVRLEELLDAVPVAIALFDERLAFVRANACFYELLGRTSLRPGVDKLLDLFPDWPADLAVLDDGFFFPEGEREEQQPHPRSPVQFALYRGGSAADGAAEGEGEVKVVEAVLTPVRAPNGGGGGRGVCFTALDVVPGAGWRRGARQRTSGAVSAAEEEAARLDRLVAQRTQELLHLQDARARERRLAAVGQLAAGVMHDVNNSLNPILAAAHLLMLHADDPAAVRDYASRIANAAETGAATAARVGRFIRQEPHVGTNEELIDLSVVADEVVAMTRPVWGQRAPGKALELRRAVADGALTRGTATEVREALINLVQNALDAMADTGGTLGVTTRVEGAEAVVEVSDTGPGMSPEVCERAFEPFFTTKGSRGGTGLGLSEVYGIMKGHRGRAEIISAPGAGTTVRLVFPLATALTLSGEIHAFLDRIPKRILVVDGDGASRDLVRALLAADGHVVDAAASAAEAGAWLDAAGARYGRYDLLLVAPTLPDGSGAAIADAARVWWPDLRVGCLGVVASGGEPLRCDFTVAKPVRREELLALAGADDDAAD